MIWLTVGLATALFVLGQWGAGHAQELAPRILTKDARDKHVRVMRRGATTLRVVAGGLLLLVLIVAAPLAARLG